MDNDKKFVKAVANLRPFTEMSWSGGAPTTEEMFDNVLWITGQNEHKIAITTAVNPHSELTWEKVSAEMDRLEAEYVSKEYARTRENEYPFTREFIEAYTEKEIGGDSTKWDAYVIKYNQVRSDNLKP